MTTAPATTGITAVLFDMDGTLVDSEKLWSVALEDYAAHRGGALSDAVREDMVGSNMPRSMRLMLDDLGLPAVEEDVAAAGEWVVGRMRELFAAGLPWRPGAQEALRAARAQGLRTALVTSTIRSLTEQALDTVGREHFDATVCGDEVGGRNKPDPEPYRRACELLGLAPERCLAVEDSPTGVAAAEAAGCLVLAVPCEVPVPDGPRRVLRDSLERVDFGALGSLAREVA
ncbi:HAD family phosphatase [Salinifilum aidingensis]